MSNVMKSFKYVCLCSILNILLLSFILIISFYLIRRVNRINFKKNVEQFQTSSFCKPVIKNEINMNKLSSPLSKIAKSLENIDAKLDFINGFKTIKTKGKSNREREVNRKNYPYGVGSKKPKEDD